MWGKEGGQTGPETLSSPAKHPRIHLQCGEIRLFKLFLSRLISRTRNGRNSPSHQEKSRELSSTENLACEWLNLMAAELPQSMLNTIENTNSLSNRSHLISFNWCLCGRWFWRGLRPQIWARVKHLSLETVLLQPPPTSPKRVSDIHTLHVSPTCMQFTPAPFAAAGEQQVYMLCLVWAVPSYIDKRQSIRRSNQLFVSGVHEQESAIWLFGLYLWTCLFRAICSTSWSSLVAFVSLYVHDMSAPRVASAVLES